MSSQGASWFVNHNHRTLQFSSRPFVTLQRFATLTLATACFTAPAVYGQVTATPNGVVDQRLNAYALSNALLYMPDGEFETGGLLIREGEIVDVLDSNDSIPDGYFEIDLSGHRIYPGLIDIYTHYGQEDVERAPGSSSERLFSEEGAGNVNDAIKANFRSSVGFEPDEDERSDLREMGFSTVLSFRPDGIARGSSALITLGEETANESIIVADASTHYSLDKGSSPQTVPVSPMGSFALLRQTYLDADWFAPQQPRPFTDVTLEAMIDHAELPQIFDAPNWQLALSADKIGDEFGIQYILKTSGDSYKRADLMLASGASLIVPLDFPDAPEVDDLLDTESVSLEDLKHWELAPFNPRILAEAGVNFALTANGAGDDFWPNLRLAVDNGLPKSTAIDALTRIPAELLGVSDRVGQLAPGALANFIVVNGDLLEDDAVLLENWIHGQRYELQTDLDDRAGSYLLTLGGDSIDVELSFSGGSPQASLTRNDEEADAVAVELDEDLITIAYTDFESGERLRLSGWSVEDGWRGNGRDGSGSLLSWTLNRVGDLQTADASDDSAAPPPIPGSIPYPFAPFGRDALPSQQDFVVRNATVWTMEDEGILQTDVLVRAGIIAGIGQNIRANGVTEIDGTGMHLTPGIIDEHSHIGLFAINEVATNSSMVRMKDVVNAENINIYRNLAGGVVAAQLLHGSANPVGGQSALIKMRWGEPASGLLIEGADEFIKFALGENVKRSRNPASVRYPQTRMGVEQVFVNAFSQAREYGRAWDDYNSLSRAEQRNTVPPRRDLVHEAMLEILNQERWVTVHSYVQSEINMMMEVAESFDFNINTFTHILEGYKVADKMAAHGAGGSTFADWWGYKWEVRYAIPYNAALMLQAGVVVAINSDDAEMSRRLNQEAAKAVKYGDVSEIDAMKMVTLNPAKLLHLDDRMGSIAEGKDADIVLWTDHPLSVYAEAHTTWVDGTAFYSQEEDQLLRQQVADERARLIAAVAASR